jgi:hypothetical protein
MLTMDQFIMIGLTVLYDIDCEGNIHHDKLLDALQKRT